MVSAERAIPRRSCSSTTNVAQLHRQRGAAPPRATPAQRPGGGLEQRQDRAFERGRQDSSPALLRGALASFSEAERSSPVGPDDPIDTGARTKEDAGHFARGPPSGAQEQQMERE